MVVSPYNAPAYFPPSYFYGEATLSPSPGVGPYNAPAYFPPSYFYGAAPDATSSGSGPYNSPSYFSPSYFYGPASDPNSPGQGPYNAPSYFPPSYFFGPASRPVAVPTLPKPRSFDHDGYGTILGLLAATGAFDEVILGDTVQRNRAGAGRYPLAVVRPKGWEEVDDYDPAMIVRKASFEIRVVVRGEDEGPQFELLDQLSSIVQDVINRADLGRGCLPALTRIREGRYEEATHYPELCVALEGEFSSIVGPRSNDTAPGV